MGISAILSSDIDHIVTFGLVATEQNRFEYIDGISIRETLAKTSMFNLVVIVSLD